MAPNRVEQIALHARRLAQATGVAVDGGGVDSGAGAGVGAANEGLDGITSDLDIEALAKGLMDVTRDLDLYLRGLLAPRDAPLKALQKDITRLEKELVEKDRLIANAINMVRDAERSMGALKKDQLATLYNL